MMKEEYSERLQYLFLYFPLRNNSHLIHYQQVDFLLFVQLLVFGVIFKKGLVEGEYIYEAKWLQNKSGLIHECGQESVVLFLYFFFHYEQYRDVSPFYPLCIKFLCLNFLFLYLITYVSRFGHYCDKIYSRM